MEEIWETYNLSAEEAALCVKLFLLEETCFADISAKKQKKEAVRDKIRRATGCGRGVSLWEEEVKELVRITNFFSMAERNNGGGIRQTYSLSNPYPLLASFTERRTQLLTKDEEKRLRELARLLAAALKDKKKKKSRASRKLYIADLHFFHGNLCRQMDCRGFSSEEEMNEYMISRFNEKVRDNDEVYLLGDVSMAGAEPTNRVLKRLNGRLHLIVGNHDKYLSDRHFDKERFSTISPYAEIHDEGRKVVLCHYPVFCYNGQYRTNDAGEPLTYMLYGHVHHTMDEALVRRFVAESRETMVQGRFDTEPRALPCHMINCFCMDSDYQPLTLKEWIEVEKKRSKA